MRGVLGIVPAGVKKVADIVRLKDLKKPVCFARGLLRLSLEVDFVSAGPQGRGGCVLQPFDGRPFLLLQINQFLIENSQNAVPAAVELLDLVRMPARFLDYPGQAGVNDRRGSARLCDE